MWLCTREDISERIFKLQSSLKPGGQGKTVESIVVKLNIHQKVTLRVLVLNFHS